MGTNRVERRLAAIVAADVAGYSRLMGLDEVGTARTLREHRAASDALVAKHGGRIVKTTGDGVLLEFPSVVHAVECAVAVQVLMAERNEGVPQHQRMLYRIGINLGDILIEGDDILGDGVNVAARLEGIAEPGGICISSSAYDQVCGKVGVEFAEMGEQSLKNIARPVRTYAAKLSDQVGAGALPPGLLHKIALPLPDRPSIAVLPFQNMSSDPGQEYFADGLVEDIITALSRFKSLFVIARNSSFTYKGKAVDIKQVGRELGVRYVLEGSVRKAGDKVRITGQLIDSSTGAHLWADRFDGSLDDVFALQDQITGTVVNAIAPRVEQAEIERTKGKPTDHLDAYDYYLRGIARLNLMMVPGNGPGVILIAAGDARNLFLKATEIDPDFSRAYARAAQCCLLEYQNAAPTADRNAIVTEAVRLSRRSVVLGKDDALTLCYAGQTLAYLGKEIDEGGVLLERALMLNPNLSLAWNFGGWLKIFLGEPQQAIERFATAMRLSPLDPFMFLMDLGTSCGHLFRGDYEKAAEWANKALQERPRVIIVLRIAAACFALAGRLDEARNAVTRLGQVAPHFRISQVKGVFPLRRPEDLARYCAGLRLAGLPE